VREPKELPCRKQRRSRRRTLLSSVRIERSADTSRPLGAAASRRGPSIEPKRVPYISHATNGINFTELERQRLKSIRYQPPDQATPEELTAA
jgi:hypothetical protein